MRDLTYVSDVSVALLLSASESAATPAGPIWSFLRLQRGEREQMESQGCSWRDFYENKIGTEQGAGRRARATYLSRVSKLKAFASLSLFLPLSSSFSTTALAFIFAPPSNARLLKSPH